MCTVVLGDDSEGVKALAFCRHESQSLDLGGCDIRHSESRDGGSSEQAGESGMFQGQQEALFQYTRWRRLEEYSCQTTGPT